MNLSILDAEHLAFKARYRMGDQIALLTMIALVERQRSLLRPDGVKPTWYAMDGPAATALKDLLAPDLPPIHSHAQLGELPHGGREFEEFLPVIESNLWQWNWYFKHTDFRLPVLQYDQTEPKHVIFAPLLECGYSQDRTMHPWFVETLIYTVARPILESGGKFSVLMPSAPSLFTRSVIERSCSYASHPVEIISAPLPTVIRTIAKSGMYIGGDTGLSHVAGCIPHVHQLSLHDKGNTERHVERRFDHEQFTRNVTVALMEELQLPAPAEGWAEMIYDSFPNKAGLVQHLFDNHGAESDGSTLRAVTDAVTEFLTAG